MANKEMIVQLASSERLFTRCYHDFIDCNLLNGEEKIIFLALKRFLDVKSDNGNVFPAIETIQKMTGWGNQKVIKYINSLRRKGIVKKIRQGLNKPNIYILSDYPSMWAAANEQKMKQAIKQEQVTIDLLKYSDEDLSKEIERRKKEKGLESDTDQSTESSTQINQYSNKDNNVKMKKNQVQERYTLNQIHQLFDYDILIHDNPYEKENIDTVMDILHTAMNTNKPAIRISGQDMPAMAVIGKLMKLDKESIMYAIGKFAEHAERIKNPAAYMLTVLYHAPEQFHLDILNQVSYDMAHGN